MWTVIGDARECMPTGASCWDDGNGTVVRRNGPQVTCVIEQSGFARVDLAASVMTLSGLTAAIAADQVLPRAIDLAGRLVCHAALVTTAQGAVAILGPTGAGKSTLSAWLSLQGMAHLSDDAVMLTESPGAILARPTYSRLYLRDGPLRDRLADRGAVTLDDLREMLNALCSPGKPPADPGHPLRAAVVLAPAPATDRVRCDPLGPAEAMAAVLANSFALDPTEPVRARERMGQIAAVVARVLIYRLTAPRRETALPELAAAIHAATAKEPAR